MLDMFAVSDLSCNSGLYMLLDTLNDRLIDLIDYRRDRKQLRSTKDPLQESIFEMDEDDHMNVNPQPQKTQLSQVATPNAEKQTATTPPRPQPPYATHTPEKSERTPQVPITSEIRSRYGRLINQKCT